MRIKNRSSPSRSAWTWCSCGVESFPNVQADSFDTLLVDYAEKQQGQAIIRGLRAVSDFEFEFQLALMNRKLNGDVETIFMMPRETYTFLSSRIVKEIARLGGNVSRFRPWARARGAGQQVRPGQRPTLNPRSRFSYACAGQHPPFGSQRRSVSRANCPRRNWNWRTPMRLVQARLPLRYDLTAQKLGGAILARGRMELTLDCECARCLKPFEHRIILDHWTAHLPAGRPGKGRRQR